MTDIQTDCFPVCKACKERGSCDKVWDKPKPVSSLFGQSRAKLNEWMGQHRPKPTPFPVGKETPSHFELKCHHWTTREEQRVFDVWRPSHTKYWCGRCGKWKTRERAKVNNDSEKICTQLEVPF